MSAPILEPIPSPTILSRHAARAGQWFRAVAAGEALGLSLAVGDRVLVRGRPHVDDLVVLAPVGRGVPRLGRVGRDGLIGDRGEACGASRWTPVGRVVRVIPVRGSARAVGQAGAWSMPQLPLFPEAPPAVAAA